MNYRHLQINACYTKITFLHNIYAKYNVSFDVKWVPLFPELNLKSTGSLNCEYAQITKNNFTECTEVSLNHN